MDRNTNFKINFQCSYDVIYDPIYQTEYNIAFVFYDEDEDVDNEFIYYDWSGTTSCLLEGKRQSTSNRHRQIVNHRQQMDLH